MILDTFKLRTFTIRLDYDVAFELWDNAGSVARALNTVWGPLTVKQPTPNQQVLENSTAQLFIGMTQSFIVVKNGKAFDRRGFSLISRTFEILARYLSLHQITRVSARASYVMETTSIGEANSMVRSFPCVNWPSEKVFGQDPSSDLNTGSFSFRFQDEASFSVVDVKSEQVHHRAELEVLDVTDAIDVKKNYVVIEFDRGTLGVVEANQFRIEDWLKGYRHVLNRDIDKVLEGISK